MFYTFNELSLLEQNEVAGLEILEKFAETCSELFNNGLRSIKFGNRESFLAHEFTPGVSVASILKDTPKFSKRQQILLQKLKSIIAASSKIWDEEHRQTVESCPLIFIDDGQRQKSPEGLKIACILNTISVSLLNNLIWDFPKISAIWVEEQGHEILQQIVQVNHAAKIQHLQDHGAWFKVLLKKRKVFSTWNPAKEYFPNLMYSNELVKENNWDNYTKERDSTETAEQRLSVIVKYGRAVAERNGYIYNGILSKRNTIKKKGKEKKRTIFEAGIGRDRIYLSIDMETGGFEVCNYKGYHLGEYFYDGTQRTGPLHHHSIHVF